MPGKGLRWTAQDKMSGMIVSVFVYMSFGELDEGVVFYIRYIAKYETRR